jgi:polyhydroxyalkanoate synthesis regulator protein
MASFETEQWREVVTHTSRVVSEMEMMSDFMRREGHMSEEFMRMFDEVVACARIENDARWSQSPTRS